MKLNKKIRKLIVESMQEEIKENYPHAKSISIISGFDRGEYQDRPNIVGILNNDDSWEYLGEEAYEDGIFYISADDLTL